MSEMTLIERAALAAWVAYSVDDDIPDDAEEGDGYFTLAVATRQWNEWPQGCTHIGADGFRAITRAVLQAIREPSDRMIEAGDFDEEGGIRGGDNAEMTWKLMIDAALAETSDV